LHTRPLYSADENQSLIRNAAHCMDADDYISMLDKLDNAGVLNDHYKQAAEEMTWDDTCRKS